MALYSLEEFQTLIKKNGLYLFNSKNTRNFQYSNGWKDIDIENCLCFLIKSDFIKTKLNNKLEIPFRGIKILDADVYKVGCCADLKIRADENTQTIINIYIKLAIIKDKKGAQAGTVSFHRENG